MRDPETSTPIRAGIHAIPIFSKTVSPASRRVFRTSDPKGLPEELFDFVEEVGKEGEGGVLLRRAMEARERVYTREGVAGG